MTLKIIKPDPAQTPEPLDADAARTALIAGMVSDEVYDKHTAVEGTGARNWGQIAGIYKELEGELKMLSAKADDLARDGVTNGAIVSGVNAVATYFDANDVRQMKVEQYDTVTKWLNAMKV